MLGLAIDAESHNIIVQGEIGGAAPAIQVFDSTGNYLSQFGGFGTTVGGAIALDPVSHHIVTIVGNMTLYRSLERPSRRRPPLRL